MEHFFFLKNSCQATYHYLNLGDLAENLSSTKCKPATSRKTVSDVLINVYQLALRGQRKSPICKFIANFCGVNTPSVADFKLLT